MGMTAVMAIGLTLFAVQTKWDFTKLGGALFVGVFLLFVGSIVQFTIRSHALGLFLSCFGLTLFSVYLIGMFLINNQLIWNSRTDKQNALVVLDHTQKVIGGEHEYQLSPEDYITGTLDLYLDILRIFRYISRILASKVKRKKIRIFLEQTEN